MEASEFAEKVQREREQWREYRRSQDEGPSDECDDCGDETDLNEALVRGGYIVDLCDECMEKRNDIL